MDKLNILVADSCAGGIAVLSNIKNQFRNPKFVFLADGEKNPFGLKKDNEIIKIVEDWAIFAKKNGYDMLIVACNTASIAVYFEVERIEKEYNIRIITMINALKNAIKELTYEIEQKNVVVFGTRYTVNSYVYMSMLEQAKPNHIYSIEGTESERLVARGLLKDKNQIEKAKQEMAKHIDKNIDTIFLACTCFEFIQEYLKKLYPQSRIINLNKYLIISDKNNRISNIDIEYKTTGALDIWTENINLITNIVFGKMVSVDKIIIR